MGILNDVPLIIILAFLIALTSLVIFDKTRGIKTSVQFSISRILRVFCRIVRFPFRLAGKIIGIFIGGIVMAGGLLVLALVYLSPIILLAAFIAFFLKVF